MSAPSSITLTEIADEQIKTMMDKEYTFDQYCKSADLLIKNSVLFHLDRNAYLVIHSIDAI